MLAMLAEFVWTEKTVALVCVFAVPVLGIVGGLCYHAQKVRSDNELKRTMIERGMSVDEIERVMKAGPKG